MSEIYNAGDVVDKTLIARTEVPVYKFPDEDMQPFGVIDPGDPVGIVYAWLGPDPAQGRTRLWWQFSPASNYSAYYYAPHEPGMYDVSAIRQQGVISTEEKIEEEKDKDRPWYEKLIKDYGPWLIGAALAAAAIKGYFSRPKQ